MLSRAWPKASILVVLCLASAPAAAQEIGGNIDLNAFRPAVDSRGFITVNASQVLGHKEISFGLVTNWGRNVLTFENESDPDQTYEVANVISPTLIGAFGLKFGPAEIQFAASVPFNIMSGDRNPDSDNGTPANPNDDQNFDFDGQGLGDIGLHLKTRFLSTSKGPRIGLAVIGR